MQISNYSFEHLPFSKLFKTYVNDFQQLADSYSINPFDEKAIAQKVKQFHFTGDRQTTVQILTGFNKKFDVDQATFDNLDRLKQDDSLVVVTGQQLGIYGGPLYTIMKTISVLHLAKKFEQRFDRPVIPVFWLADEDHDYEEVRSLSILDDDQLETFSLPSKSNHLAAVSQMEIPEQINELRKNLRDSLYDTDFAEDLWEMLDSCFQPGQTFLEAFGCLMVKLFSKHGLVLAGSYDQEVKKATGHILKESISEADAIRQALEQQSGALKEEFHQQVTLYDSNLFYLDGKNGRTKISRNGNGWKTDTGQNWETDQLLNEIETHPQKFSPNVFLRPLLQDGLLPTLGYVAGPGEIAYYGQMKDMYACFDIDMPVIFPRLSATMVEPAIDRILKKLPFEFHEYSRRIEDLESDFVDRTEQIDIETVFSDWKEQIGQLENPKKEKIANIDETLEGAVEKATSAYCNELNKLKGKVYRAVKKRDEIQLKRIRRIKGNLFPGDGLQERLISGIFFMNKYGLGIWDKLLNSLEAEEEFDHHKIIHL